MPKTLAGARSPKRPPLSLRTTEALRKRLEENALLSGRSLAQEVEFRLERSFAEPDVLARAFGGHTLADFIRAIGIGLQIIQAKTGDSSMIEPDTRGEIVVLFTKLIRERLVSRTDDWANIMQDLENRPTGPGAEAAEVAIAILAPTPMRAREPLNI